MTDLKKLLGDSPLLENERRRVAEQEALLRGSAFSAAVAALDPREELSKTVTGQVMESALRSAGSLSEQIRLGAMGLVPKPMTAIEQMEEAAMDHQKRHDALVPGSLYQSPMLKEIEKANATYLTQMGNPLGASARSRAELEATVAGSLSAASLQASNEQLRQDIVGRTYTAKTVSEHLEEMARNDPFSSPTALARLKNDGLLAPVHDHRSFEEIERERQEKQFAESSALIAKQHHQMERQAATVRKREDEKVEYARRSAEASEASVAALKAALVAEEKRTADALEEAAAAKKEARRARSNTRIALWFAGASMLLTAWSFIKDQF